MQSLLAPFRVIWQALTLWWDDLINLFVLNLIWILCWLTIILGPPATFGMVQITRQLVEGSFPNWRDMYEAARQYFIKSWQWMLTNLLVISILVVNVLFYDGIEAAWSLYVQVIFIGLLFLWLVVQFYSIPFFIIQDDKSLKMAWKNGLLMTLASPLFSFTIWITALLILILSVVTTIPIIIGTGIIVPILGNMAVKDRLKVFGELMAKRDEESTAEDEEA